MKNITIIWTVTLVIIVGILTLIGFKIKGDNINELMEDEMVKQVENYLGLYPGLYPLLGDEKKFTYEELKDKGYDAKLEKGCTGYVIVKTEADGFKYHPYISCPEYKTEGYSK